MGVLNVTPDSFSDGGSLFVNQAPQLDKIMDVAGAMVEAGAAVLDIGGESTRPGAAAVSVAAELDRVLPVVAALVDTGALLSVDTRHAEVARQAIAAGVDIVNDVSAGADPDMLPLIAASNVGYAVLHMQGEPRTMQDDPRYDDVVGEVRTYLAERVAACVDAGIDRERLIVDPGFGFGKTLEHNLTLFARLSETRVDGLPLLAGVSRKRMLGTITGREVGDRRAASVAAALLAAERGADLLRVHDVADTVDALKVLSAVNGST